jgi:quercetin dioxygenase-like cupin family protein
MVSIFPRAPREREMKKETIRKQAYFKSGRESIMASKTTMSVFRAIEAPQMTGEDAHLEAQPGSEPDGMALLFEAGLADGTIVKRLFDAPGFSLIYNWFKPGFPLPRHSHDTDCLYYIVGGTLRLGTEDLGPGDGFFMPADTPYTYKVGDEGVQVIEFRHEGHFSMRTMGSPTYWEKAIATVTASREDWLEEVPPKPALLPVC